MSLTRIFASLAVSMPLILAALPAHAESAEAVTDCAQPLPENGYLASDLSCEKGFVLSYPDAVDPVTVTLDMRGHRLSGSGLSADTAFTVTGGLAPVAFHLSNGRIDHWSRAVDVRGGEVHATFIRADHNKQVLACGGVCSVKESILSANTIVATADEARIELAGNVISGNGVGLRMDGTGSAVLRNNVLSYNTTGVDMTSYSFVELTKNYFKRNTVGVTSHVPEEVGEAYYASLTQNVFVSNTDGIYLPAGQGGSELTGNVAVRNARYGVFTPSATDSGGNKAAANGHDCVGVVCAKPSLRESPLIVGGTRRTSVSPSRNG